MASSSTLYVKNLNDKIQKDRLKEALYTCFSAHGNILEIVMGKARKLRGQAWVVFDTPGMAQSAKQSCEKLLFFEKEMVIQYAKTTSDVIAKREGTFVPREKRRRRETDVNKSSSSALGGGHPPGESSQSSHGGAGSTSHSTSTASMMMDKSSKKLKTASLVRNEPNKILFLEHLPTECTQEMLSILFQQYHGFKEVRMVPGKKDLAFVEFGDDMQAGIALQGLYGFKLTPTDVLHVNFARK